MKIIEVNKSTVVQTRKYYETAAEITFIYKIQFCLTLCSNELCYNNYKNIIPLNT